MSGVSTLGQALDQMERLKNMQSQLSLLQTQLTTNKKTDLFKGLGTDVIASQRSRANFNMIDTYVNNITIADRRIKMMDNALTEITGQTGDLANALIIQTQQGEFEKESVSDLADKVLAFMNDLLNEKDGDRYLFAGAENMTKPLLSTGTLDTYTQARVDDWVNGTLSTDDLIQSYRDKTQLTDTIIGYSAPLTDGSAKKVYVRVEQNTELDMTVLANTDALRDIMAAANMLKSLCNGVDEVTLDPDDPTTTITAPGATQQEQNDNFYKVFNDIAAMLNNAIDTLDTQSFKLSNTQAQMTQIKNNHTQEKAILQKTVDDVENVDLNEVAMKINSLATQLEASYRVTATVSSLNLTNFMPIG